MKFVKSDKNHFFKKRSGVKEFHGLQDDLKIIWKSFIPWPLFMYRKYVHLKNGINVSKTGYIHIRIAFWIKN